jgi:hypothetical protein
MDYGRVCSSSQPLVQHNAASQRQRALGFTGKSIDPGDAEQLRIGKYRRALCPLHWLVYAQHGRELMGLKSPVHGSPPPSLIERRGSTRRRQLRKGDRPWEGSRRSRL